MKSIGIEAVKNAIFWTGLVLMGWLGCTAVSGAEEITLVKGASASVPFADGVRKISVSNPIIIDARPSADGNAVIITGLAEGSSDLVVEPTRGNPQTLKVKVQQDLQEVMAEIKEVLGEIEGLEVKTLSNKILLKGTLVTKSDAERVSKVSQAYAGVVLNLTKYDLAGMADTIVAAILTDIGLDTVTARINGDTVILEGVVYSEAESARAQEMAKLRMPNVRSLLRVQELMIETDVQFLQIDSAKSTDFGQNILKTLAVNADAGISGAGHGKPSVKYGVTATASASIRALIGNGNGKILAEPHLSTKSGGVGTFHSGGEVFFTVSSLSSSSLESVPFGVIVRVKPTLQGRDSIVNEITVQVSLPSAKPLAGGTMSLDKFETTSTVISKPGESIILSGLAQALSAKFKDRTPILGDIPILSLFFAEKVSRGEQRDLVLVITPMPVFPQAATRTVPFSEDRKRTLQSSLGGL